MPYHFTMVRLLLALLIALLPLRGWVGDAMAMDISLAWLATEPTTSASAGMDPAAATVTAHDACAGHDGEAAGPPASRIHPDCGTCTSCQVCHAVALVASVPSLPAMPRPAAAPGPQRAAFVSAVPAPGLKPPIS